MENADQLPSPSKINIPKLLNPNFLVENVFIFSVLVLFLSMYGPRLHPKLPVGIKRMFDNIVFRGLVLFLIAYMSQRDFPGALIVAIIFMITMNIVNSTKVLDKFNNYALYKRVPIPIQGGSVANCNVYKSSDETKLGTKFYPLHDNNDLRGLRGGDFIGREMDAELNLDRD